MWNKLPIKDRLDLMRVYKRNNYSYSDMVKDYNESVKKYAEGGETDPEPSIIVGGITDKIHDLPEVTIVDEKPKNMFAPKNWATTYGAQPTSTPVNFVTPNYPKTEQEARTRLENEDRAKFESYLDQVDEYTKLGMSFDEAQDAAKRVNKQIDRPDVLREYTPKSLTQKTLQVAMNPVEAFKQYNKYGYVADNYSDSDLFSPTGILDLGYQFLTTPGQIASVTNAGYNIPKDIAQGNYVSAIANSLDVLPGVSGAILSDLPGRAGKYLTTKKLPGSPNSKFQSEIDWGKWNPDTPKYPELINEYNAIEESTKKAGTWMKNADGSLFQGTPEQFIQQQSSHFKKAFPNVLRDEAGNIQKTYHGSRNTFDFFDPNIMMTGRTRGQGIYTSPFKERAASYATKGDKKIYELYQNANKLQDIIEQFNKASDQRFKDFLEKNPKGSKDFDKKFDEFMKKEDELYNLTDEDFNLQQGYDFLKASPDEYVVPFTNYPKSTVGNVGFFDMTNPNIYKSLLPIILGTAELSRQNQSQETQDYKQGGLIHAQDNVPILAGSSQNYQLKLNDDIQQGVIMKALEQKFKKGGMIKRADGSYSRRGLWDNIRANRGSGKKPTPEMLKQERKIKAKYPDGGTVNSLEGDLISKIIMNRNKNKDFVQRAYALGQNPDSRMFTLPDSENFGEYMSHKMSWGEDEKGQAYMFPTIMNFTNESIKIPNQYADYITSIGYKKATGMVD